jgi:hypothetical protein
MFKDIDDTPLYVKVLFPGYFRPYTHSFKQLLRARMKGEFGAELEDNHDTFWLAWSFVCANSPVAYRRSTHFLELYGFSRNMSMSFLLLVPSTWFALWTNAMNGYVWSIGASVAAWLLFVNYTKLLRRLNDEVYRAFVVTASRHDGLRSEGCTSAGKPTLGMQE